jgi:hypothetical protein
VEPENWLAYFREDIALNLHHWNWHIDFPFIDAKDKFGNDVKMNKDRRGELFLYMHHQVIARYFLSLILKESKQTNKILPIVQIQLREIEQ